MTELFSELAEINTVLGLGDDAFISQLETVKAQLPPLKINYFGGVQEWIEDYQEVRTFSPFFLLSAPGPRFPSSLSLIHI